MAIIFPVIVVLTLMVVQGSLWWYAREVAQTAAREGVTAGRSYGAGPASGTAQARAFLDRNAGNNLRSSSVSSAGSDTETIRITVSGHAPSLVPGLDGIRIEQRASGPVERWTTAQEE